MMNPKVSIITPSYNRGDMIEETIKSVLAQNFENIEYIVIDGMSTDNTIEILERYRSEGKLQYVSEKDDGMYYAINKGIRMAQGDIIAYINSDDRYFPWSVQKAVEIFQKYSEINMIYGDSYVVDTIKNGNRLNLYPSFKQSWLPLGGTICQPTVFLRRCVFEKVGVFNTEFKYLADCEFWQRINSIMSQKILKVDEVLAIEYNHDGMIRHTFQEDIKIEKEKLVHMYASKYSGNKVKLLILKLSKERKLWKFIFVNLMEKVIKFKSWRYFLSGYNANINLIKYFFYKLYNIVFVFKKDKKKRGHDLISVMHH